MITVLLTFLMTTALYLALFGWAFRRIARHLQGNEAALKAVTHHVLLPLLGRQNETDEAGTPDGASAGGDA